jgi:TfoX/Sxy family transcriptional regulator of competence genes
MAYDTGLAHRLEERLDGVRGVTSKEMFGGIAFLVDGKMFIGVVKDELMVRVGKEHHDVFLQRPGARTMDFTGRPMRGYVFVAPEGFRSDKALHDWVEAGLAFTRTVVAKKPARKASPKRTGGRSS